MSHTSLQANQTSRIFASANINPKYRTFDANYYTVWYWLDHYYAWSINLFILYYFYHGYFKILCFHVYIHRKTTYAILYCLIFLIGNVHRLYARTKIVTKQVMVPESSRRNFATAKSHVTIKATASLGSVTADIHSYVASHWRFVKMQIRHYCQIWRSRPGV